MKYATAFLWVGLLLSLSGGVGAADYIVPCGEEILLHATPLPDFHFVRWGDGNTDSVRTLTVERDEVIVAYFAPNCGDYAALPLVNRYDWILMVNVRAILEMGYTLSPERVTWYRVQGTVDSVDDPDITDFEDEWLGTGYSFTLDKDLHGSGSYYALVDLVEVNGLTCYGLSRTELAHFQTDEPLLPRPQPLQPPHPNPVARPESVDALRVYTVSGQLLKQVPSVDDDRVMFRYSSQTFKR